MNETHSFADISHSPVVETSSSYESGGSMDSCTETRAKLEIEVTVKQKRLSRRDRQHVPEVGNVYPAKGGHGKGSPDVWVVIAIICDKAVLLGLKKDGSVVSSQSYNCFALRERELLGKVDITQLRFSEQ